MIRYHIAYVSRANLGLLALANFLGGEWYGERIYRTVERA